VPIGLLGDNAGRLSLVFQGGHLAFHIGEARIESFYLFNMLGLEFYELGVMLAFPFYTQSLLLAMLAGKPRPPLPLSDARASVAAPLCTCAPPGPYCCCRGDHADHDDVGAMLAMLAGKPRPPLPLSDARAGKLGPQGFSE
jgi:hypothetical protein